MPAVWLCKSKAILEIHTAWGTVYSWAEAFDIFCDAIVFLSKECSVLVETAKREMKKDKLQQKDISMSVYKQTRI